MTSEAKQKLNEFLNKKLSLVIQMTSTLGSFNVPKDWFSTSVETGKTLSGLTTYKEYNFFNEDRDFLISSLKKKNIAVMFNSKNIFFQLTPS